MKQLSVDALSSVLVNPSSVVLSIVFVVPCLVFFSFRGYDVGENRKSTL